MGENVELIPVSLAVACFSNFPKKHVISTEAADSLIVRRGVENLS